MAVNPRIAAAYHFSIHVEPSSKHSSNHPVVAILTDWVELNPLAVHQCLQFARCLSAADLVVFRRINAIQAHSDLTTGELDDDRIAIHNTGDGANEYGADSAHT
jgi:hypothetical protein